jgi:5'-3' exonuclease
MSETAVLIDLSSIAHPIFHVTASDPNPNATSIQTVAKVRALATGQTHVAVCCDSGRSFRAEIDSTYKANRPESDATLQHQITLARETLQGDGFPVWAVRGFEADDLIGTAAKLALEAGMEVLVVSSDKDLLQLVGPRVKAKSLRDGSILDEKAVVDKFGVLPEQMRDYLSLVGDSSDNVKGAKGIGPKKAQALLLKHATLDALYADIAEVGYQDLGIKPSEAVALDEFKERYPTVRRLIALRDDVPIQFSEIMTERVAKDAATFLDETMEEEMDTLVKETLESAANLDALGVLREANGVADLASDPLAQILIDGAKPVAANGAAPPPVALAVREEQVIDAVPVEWERQLDPRSPKEARILAADLHASRMFSAYGTPQAVLSTIMAGRELGFPAMASLRSFHIIEGKASLSAGAMVATVLRSGVAEYFRPVSFGETEATFETLRKGPGNKPITLKHTVEMGRTAWPKKTADWEKSFLASGWGRNPTDMVVSRAESRLARMIYPDILAGLYTPEELAEMRENDRAA